MAGIIFSILFILIIWYGWGKVLKYINKTNVQRQKDISKAQAIANPKPKKKRKKK